ncbi:MAG: class I SAM-dependent methyltransferase [Tenacibaculum sp.]
MSKILEIGTNLGVSGQYFLKALQHNKKHFDINFTTIERVKGLYSIAEKRFKEISDKNNFNLICGLYDDMLPQITKEDTKFDFVFYREQ